jgi:hypothetical protein
MRPHRFSLRPAILAVVLAAASAQAMAAELSTGFQGRWYALGDCSEKNDVSGALITLGPAALEGHDFSCTFTGIAEKPEGDGKRADLHRACKAGDKQIEADVRMYLVPSEIFGEVLVTVNQDGSFLTLYKRCP